MDNKLLFVEKIELNETPHGLNIYDLWTVLLSGFWVDRIGIWGEFSVWRRVCLSLFSVISLLIVLNAQLSFYLGTFHKLLTSLSDLSRGRGFDLLNLLSLVQI